MKKKEGKSVIQKYIEYGLTFLLTAMTVLTFYQVVMRYAFNNAPSWSEELVRFIFVWASFIAAAVGIKEHTHLGIDAVTIMLPERIKRVLQIIAYILITIFGGALVYSGIPVVVMTNVQPSPALGIPMSYVYVAIPLMGVLLAYYSIIEIYKIIKNFKGEVNC